MADGSGDRHAFCQFNHQAAGQRCKEDSLIHGVKVKADTVAKAHFCHGRRGAAFLNNRRGQYAAIRHLFADLLIERL